MKKSIQAALALALVTAAPALVANPFGSGSQAQGGQQEFEEARQTVMQIGQELTAIEQQAVEANPALQEKRERLQSMLMETMTEQGAEPEARISRLEELQPKLSGSRVNSEEREELMQEFQQEQQALMQAQNEALNVPEVRAAQQELQEETFAAMKAINPETEQLVERLREAQQRAQQLQGGAGMR